MASDEDALDDLGRIHAGEAEVEALGADGELLVIEAELVQECGVDVLDVDGIFDGSETEFVCLAIDGARFESAAANHMVKASM